VGLLSTSYRRDLVAVRADYAACTACNLHKNRRRVFEGVGNPNAAVMFVLDRLFTSEVTNHTFLVDSPYEDVIQNITQYLGKSVQDYWYTPVTACPTVHTVELNARDKDVTPAAKAACVAACFPRIAREIACIQPEIIVACGPMSIRAFFPTNTPSVHYHLGEVREAMLAGEHTEYPVPVMIVSSLQTLLTQQDFSAGGIWHRTCKEIQTAINIAEFLRDHVSEETRTPLVRGTPGGGRRS